MAWNSVFEDLNCKLEDSVTAAASMIKSSLSVTAVLLATFNVLKDLLK
jgi:hypothetical protein